MHLLNILNHFSATEKEIELASVFFEDKIVSFTAVERFIKSLKESSSINPTTKAIK